MEDPNFDNGFDIVAFSQGTMLSRYLIQYCPLKTQVRRFVSFGGPLNGMTDIPRCSSSTHF